MKKLGNGCLDVCKFLQAEKVEFQLKLIQDTNRKAYMSPLGKKNCVGDQANLLPLPCPQPITFAFSKRFVTRWIRDNEEIQKFTNYVRTSFHSTLFKTSLT